MLLAETEINDFDKNINDFCSCFNLVCTLVWIQLRGLSCFNQMTSSSPFQPKPLHVPMIADGDRRGKKLIKRTRLYKNKSWLTLPVGGDVLLKFIGN